MNLGTIRARCQSRFRDPTNAILTNANWNDYINDTYADVLAASPMWPFLESSSSSLTIAQGIRSVALPTNVFGVTAVYNVTDQAPMQSAEGTDRVYRVWPDQTEIGLANVYRVRGGNIEVYPLPDKNITLKIEFQAVPADLAADADVPAFPSPFHRALVVGALAYAYDDDGAGATSQTYRTTFDALLAKLQSYVFEGDANRYPGVIDTFYDR